MAGLTSIATLATWAQTPIAEEDEFALIVVQAASEMVADYMGQPEWATDATEAPREAKRIATFLALRTYQNPPSWVTSSSVGPLGERVSDLAATMALTAAETDRLNSLAPEPEGSIGGGMWILSLVNDAPANREVLLQDSYGSGIYYGAGRDTWVFD